MAKAIRKKAPKRAPKVTPEIKTAGLGPASSATVLRLQASMLEALLVICDGLGKKHENYQDDIDEARSLADHHDRLARNAR